ncbi:hypothetical protein B0H14DRAFT_2725757, partial [Mycena olivaceomarginata]
MQLLRTRWKVVPKHVLRRVPHGRARQQWDVLVPTPTPTSAPEHANRARRPPGPVRCAIHLMLLRPSPLGGQLRSVGVGVGVCVQRETQRGGRGCPNGLRVPVWCVFTGCSPDPDPVCAGASALNGSDAGRAMPAAPLSLLLLLFPSRNGGKAGTGPAPDPGPDSATDPIPSENIVLVQNGFATPAPPVMCGRRNGVRCCC